MRKRTAGILQIIIAILLVAAVTTVTYLTFRTTLTPSKKTISGGVPIFDVPITDKPVFCTMEAKLCPDGSYVSRTGPNCEFAPCPGSGPSTR